MSDDATSIIGFLETVHPYDSLPQDELARVATSFSRRELAADQVIYAAGEPMQGLFLIMQGAVEVMDPSGVLVSILGPRNSLGERGLMCARNEELCGLAEPLHDGDEVAFFPTVTGG